MATTRAEKAQHRAKSNRKAMIGSVIMGAVAFHGLLLLLFGLWTVAKYYDRPEARFEMKKTVKIPAKTPEHKMNVAKHEAMTPKPTFNDKLVSRRPVDFALPELPEVDLEQMLPLDPSELISDQVAGLVGSAGLGTGMGSGMGGGGGNGIGMSFFGMESEGTRILLLFDISTSVVNKAAAVGVPMERIREETLKLIDSLPINSGFSMIQFSRNYMVFNEEIIAATDPNKALAREWLDQKWAADAGSVSGSGVVRNPAGITGVLERAFQMRPDLVFLISDASFQRTTATGGSQDVPYDEAADLIKALEGSLQKEAPINFLALNPEDEDAKEWKRIVRRTSGSFKELKEK